MYKLTARQILMVAFASAVFAVVGVIGFQQIYNRLPFGSAANVAPLAMTRLALLEIDPAPLKASVPALIVVLPV